MNSELTYILLGTNLGDKGTNLKKSCIELQTIAESEIFHSGIYRSAAWGYESENYFLNQCIGFYTSLTAIELLEKCQEIEKRMGRLKTKSGYEDRIIDIDILLFGNQKIEIPNLIIPHPRMEQRSFALLPLCELAGKTIHPVYNISINDLLKSCKDDSPVKRL